MRLTRKSFWIALVTQPLPKEEGIIGTKRGRLFKNEKLVLMGSSAIISICQSMSVFCVRSFPYRYFHSSSFSLATCLVLFPTLRFLSHSLFIIGNLLPSLSLSLSLIINFALNIYYPKIALLSTIHRNNHTQKNHCSKHG